MIKIAMYNRKGGVGKTSLTVNLAAALDSRLDKKVLCIDCDTQCSMFDYLTTYTEQKSPHLFTEAMEELIPAHQAVTPIVFYPDTPDNKTNLYAMQFGMDANRIEEEDGAAILEKLNELESRYMAFDYCFFDMPPSDNEISKAILSISDYVLVPAIPDTDSISGLNKMIDTVNEARKLGNPNLKILGIIFSNVTYQRSTQKIILRTMREQMSDIIFKQFVKSKAVVEQARYMGYPVVYYASSSESADEYTRITRELVSRIQEGAKNEEA